MVVALAAEAAVEVTIVLAALATLLEVLWRQVGEQD